MSFSETKKNNVDKMQAMYICSACFFLRLSSIQADWINLSGAENAPNIAEVYIQDDHVQLVSEIYIRDLTEFEQLLPDDFFREKIVDRPPVEERLKLFSEETFQFVTEDGENLQAQLKLIEPRLRKERQSPFAGMINPMTGRAIPGPPEDKRVLYAELVYPYQEQTKAIDHNSSS